MGSPRALTSLWLWGHGGNDPCVTAVLCQCFSGETDKQGVVVELPSV